MGGSATLPRTTTPGEGSASGAPAILRARLPRRANLTVFRNGTPIAAADTDALDLDIATKGAYRLEARIQRRLWLLSNPVHLQDHRPR